ncbi:T-cell immunomodulatory protein [Zancudomyces culisetae]|uniref:T-cell immunomodulatory protein n=1 Tax=Zancudomyces culisetae TaxID=1213189 RepID=A0A1R1PSY4_ZANCU|nr:T-cell immunomodulatory protein [Zancudomyces culisetae]|eukprot:OMH84067.1 T-cell immunomodulatory protein [Zancudomyces culisetae]
MDEEKNTETPGFFDKIINKIKGGNYIKGKDKSVAFTSQIAILNNIPCEKSSKRQECRSNTNTNTNTADMRTFERGKYEFEEFVSMGNPLNVMVYDINANGKMDLLVSFTDPNDSSKTKLKLLYNNLYIDAFFLDTIFSPGANSTLAAISGSDKTYITGFVGPTFKAVLNDKAGDYHMYSAVQVPSTSYRPLTLPTTIIGLGRTNNYISHFYAGYSSLSQELRGGVRLFEGIIPNSKLVVYPLTDRGDGSSSAWKLMLFLNENSNVLYICATFSVLMLLLTIVIFVLYKIEAGYDKREKLEQLHAINFDAL